MNMEQDTLLKLMCTALQVKQVMAVTAMDNRGYNKGNKTYQSAFIGYFPAEDPKYSNAVVIKTAMNLKLLMVVVSVLCLEK